MDSTVNTPTREQDFGGELRRLLGSHMHVRRFTRGQLLWREGETAGLLVALRTGRVKLYRLLPAGRSVTLFIFVPGDVFGFLPFLDGGAYPAFAQAMEPVEAEVMARSTFEQVLRAEPGLALEFVTLIGRRLREAFDVIQSVSTPGARSRLASALVALVPETPTLDGRPHVELPVASHEYAHALGMEPETLSRALSGLVKQGILRRVRPRRLEVLDLPALERVAREGG